MTDNQLASVRQLSLPVLQQGECMRLRNSFWNDWSIVRRFRLYCTTDMQNKVRWSLMLDDIDSLWLMDAGFSASAAETTDLSWTAFGDSPIEGVDASANSTSTIKGSILRYVCAVWRRPFKYQLNYNCTVVGWAPDSFPMETGQLWPISASWALGLFKPKHCVIDYRCSGDTNAGPNVPQLERAVPQLYARWQSDKGRMKNICEAVLTWHVCTKTRRLAAFYHHHINLCREWHRVYVSRPCFKFTDWSAALG